MTDEATGPTGVFTPQRSNSPLPGVVREHITFGSSLIGEVETVVDETEVQVENPENRVSTSDANSKENVGETTKKAKR